MIVRTFGFGLSCCLSYTLASVTGIGCQFFWLRSIAMNVAYYDFGLLS